MWNIITRSIVTFIWTSSLTFYSKFTIYSDLEHVTGKRWPNWLRGLPLNTRNAWLQSYGHTHQYWLRFVLSALWQKLTSCRYAELKDNPYCFSRRLLIRLSPVHVNIYLERGSYVCRIYNFHRNWWIIFK
jgi:hypothetical protein